MLTTAETAESRTHIENVRWETYVALADERRGSVPRMTYDNGVLELMSPRRQHESIGSLLARMVETYTEVRRIEVQTVASTTFRRPDLQKAFEADEAYYIQNAELIRPKEEIDLSVDPPPDLVIEVEITASVIHKLKLFAAMGVPELWRHDGDSLELYQLADGAYQRIDASIVLPGFPISRESVLAKRFDLGETALIREFRQQIA